MDQQLVAYAEGALSLVRRQQDPEQEAKEAEKRVEEAAKLEEKLKFINEAIPTRVYNTMSSTAGAGSGDFHMYRIVRRQEQERLKRIEQLDKQNLEKDEFEAKNKARMDAAEERTSKRRAKRQKKKEKAKLKKAKKGQQGAAGGEGAGAAAGGGASEDESDSEDDAPEQAALD